MGADDNEPGGSLRILMVLIVVLACVVLAGCGSGAVTPPDQDRGSETRTQGGGQGGGGLGGGGGGQGSGGGQGGDDGSDFDWELPPSDTSPSGNEPIFYADLLACQGAEASIAQGWSGFNGPRNVLMYMAAAHLCHGDVAGGRPFYDRAVSEYGLSGLSPGSHSCDVYRSVASVLEQAPREGFACPGGEQPPWKTGPNGMDNPLTEDVDESQSSEESTSSSPDDASTSSSSDTSTRSSDDTSTSSSEEPARSEGQGTGSP
jgi:hypothetical protein